MYTNTDSSQLLHNHNLRVTVPRIKLLEVITSYGSAIPYSAIQKKLSDFDRVTLYRNLRALTEHGIIHRVTVDHDDNYFALCGDTCTADAHLHKHLHFHCESCGEVSCVDVQKPSITLPGYKVNKIRIEISGLCPQCLS